MSTEFVMLSGIRPGKYYNIIRFNNGINMIDIQLGRTSNKNITETKVLGKLKRVQQYGRVYDPDILLHFEDGTGRSFEYDPPFTSSYAYVEYESETEEMSEIRIKDRTKLLQEEIISNDWALRPENVVLCQCIDISRFKEGRSLADPN